MRLRSSGKREAELMRDTLRFATQLAGVILIALGLYITVVQ